MKRILLLALMLLTALSSQSFATITKVATFGDYNSSGNYRLTANRDESNGLGYLTFASDTGIVWPYLSTATTNTTLTADQSGLVFVFNNGNGTAANGTIYTLPSCTVGLQYAIVSDVAKFFRIASTGSDTFAFSTATTGSKLTNSTTAASGDSITLFCGIAGTWSVLDHNGTWTVDNNP